MTDSQLGPARDSMTRTTVPSFEAARLQARLRQRLFDRGQGLLRVGRYEVGALIGRGAMGSVYEGRDPELDRLVAIKLLADDTDEAVLAGLRREAQALAALSHPNVVKVFEAGVTCGRGFVVMELVRGTSLAQWIATHPVGSRQRFSDARELLVQAGRGLAAAHAAGLVHRDVKPSNVLVGEDGRVCVADFGLARRETPPSEPCMRSDTAVEFHSTPHTGGTPAYMPPEQFDRADVDARADQYSFCVTAFETIHGVHPFDRRPSLFREHAVASPRTPGVPRALAPILARGLEIDPRARHPTMDELLEQIIRVGRSRRGARLCISLGAVATAALLVGTPDRDLPARACDRDDPSLSSWWATTGALALDENPAIDGVARADIRAATGPWIHRFERAWSHTCDTTNDAEHNQAAPCLVERRAAFVDLITRRLADEPALRRRGRRAIDDLAEPEPCVSAEGPEPPAHDAARAEITSRLADALAAGAVDDQPRRVAVASAAMASAQAIGAEDLQGRALLQLGGWGTDASSIAALERAWELATRANDDDAAAEAAIGLSGLFATVPGAGNAELMWHGNVEAALARLGDAAELRAGYLRQRAEIAVLRDDADALDLAAASLDAWTRVPGDSRAGRARALALMGMAALDQDDGLAAVEFLRAATVLLALGGEHDNIDAAIIKLKLADALGRVGARRQSAAVLADGLAAVRTSTSARETLANPINDAGQQAFVHGHFADAIALYEEALGLLSDTQDDLRIGTIRLNLANARWFAGDLEGARRDYVAAIVRLEAIDARALLPRALSGLADVELAEGDLTSARALLERARAVIADDRSPAAFAVLVVLARIAVQTGDLDQARELLAFVETELLPRMLRRDRRVTFMITRARLDAAMGRLTSAIAGIRAALAIPGEDPPYVRALRATHHFELAELLTRDGAIDEARVEVEHALAAWSASEGNHAVEVSRARAWLRRHR